MNSKLFLRATSFLSCLFLVVLLMLFPACTKCPGDDGATNVFDSGLAFELRDKITNESLLNLDTMKIFRQDLTEESSFFVDPGGAWFKCLEYPEDLEGLNSKITKTFFLHLNKLDTDTIRIEFTLKDGDCPDPDFDEVFVFFNGKLNSEGTFGSKVEIPYQIFKK
jgi:hypothetical protein